MISGKAVRVKEVPNKGLNIHHLNETYFFPNPETFIYEAFPLDRKWQLLEKEWDIMKFADVPFVSPHYFDEKMKITSEFSGRLNTRYGECEVELTSRDICNLKLNYELYFNHKETGRDISSKLQLNNYVLMNRAYSKWRFWMRFPEAGIYKLVIVGGRKRETELCSFRIRCDRPQNDCQPLPFNPGKVGYGPSADTEAAGIKATSHKDGIVRLSERKQMIFKFTMTREVSVKSELINPRIAASDLTQNCVQGRKGQNLSVQVTLPKSGEYALTMYANQSNEVSFRNVCNYFLTSESEEAKRKRQREWEVFGYFVNTI